MRHLPIKYLFPSTETFLQSITTLTRRRRTTTTTTFKLIDFDARSENYMSFQPDDSVTVLGNVLVSPLMSHSMSVP